METSKFMTPREIAKAGICPERMVRQMIHEGTCPGILHGNRFLVNVRMFQEVLDEMSKPTGKSSTHNRR